jgi:hypothetical protein
MRNGSIIGTNENKPFAMHSVMKFPQALYVADYLSRKGLDLDDTIDVDKADLMQDTWSPMLKSFEKVKVFRMRNCWICLSDRATTMPANSFSSFAATLKQ